MAQITLVGSVAIPVTGDPRQSLLLSLSEQEVALTLQWAPLSGLWYLTLESGGVRVAGGRQISANARLIRERSFAGDFVVLPPADTPEAAAPPRNAWTTGWRLIYLTQEQVEQADAADRWL